MEERVGDAQRSKVVDLLGRAVSEGYLELTEFEQRAFAAGAAKTVPELASQLADLPRQFQWRPEQDTGTPVTADADARTTALASLVLGIVSVPATIALGAGVVFGIAAILLGRPGRRVPAQRGRALTGSVLGGVGICLSLGFIAIGLFHHR